MDQLQALRDHGYVIIPNAISTEMVQDLRVQIDEHLALTVPDAENPFMGDRTKRFGRLLFRIPASRALAQHPIVLPTARELLQSFSPTIQIHFTGVMHLLEGAGAQTLHRDITPFPNPAPTVVLGAMWAVSDFTKRNGGTVIVPGSHLWPEERSPRRSELRQIEMPAGSVLLYAGNVIHGAGQCLSGERTGLSIQYSVSWLRQEENQYLAVPQATASRFDDELLRLMGYDLAGRHWGYVDQTHPLRFLRGDETVGGLAPEEYAFKDRVRSIHAIAGEIYRTGAYEIIED